MSDDAQPINCPGMLSHVQRWAAANPLKVQALVALVFAQAPAPVLSFLKTLVA